MRVIGPRSGIYYGWVLVVTLAFTEMTSWGVLYYAFSVLLLPMEEELGWSRTAMTGAFSLALLLSGFAGIPVGRWLDRHGPRLLMTVGSIAATLLVLAWGTVESLITFYVIWAGIGIAMAMVLYEPAFAVVATWFVKRRGRALTVLTVIAALSSIVYIPLTEWLVQTQGWRSALVTLAVVLAAGTIPLHALVLRRRPADLGLTTDGFGSRTSASDELVQAVVEYSVPLRVALQSAAFWWLTVALVFTTLGSMALSIHLIPYLTEHGYSTGFAAMAASLVGGMALPGRLIFTPLGDRLPVSLVTAFLFLLQTIALLVLLEVPGKEGVLGFVVLFGVGSGAISPARAALVADFYGSANYASINGVLGLFLIGVGALAPVGVGVIYDLMGSYEPMLWALAVLSAFATLAVVKAQANARLLLGQSMPLLESCRLRHEDQAAK